MTDCRSFCEGCCKFPCSVQCSPSVEVKWVERWETRHQETHLLTTHNIVASFSCMYLSQFITDNRLCILYPVAHDHVSHRILPLASKLEYMHEAHQASARTVAVFSCLRSRVFLLFLHTPYCIVVISACVDPYFHYALLSHPSDPSFLPFC